MAFKGFTKDQYNKERKKWSNAKLRKRNPAGYKRFLKQEKAYKANELKVKARQDAERKAQRERDRLEAKRQADRQAKARRDAEREKAKREAERENARREAERQETARREADRAKARREAERKAQKEAERTKSRREAERLEKEKARRKEDKLKITDKEKLPDGKKARLIEEGKGKKKDPKIKSGLDILEIPDEFLKVLGLEKIKGPKKRKRRDKDEDLDDIDPLNIKGKDWNPKGVERDVKQQWDKRDPGDPTRLKVNAPNTPERIKKYTNKKGIFNTEEYVKDVRSSTIDYAKKRGFKGSAAHALERTSAQMPKESKPKYGGAIEGLKKKLGSINYRKKIEETTDKLTKDVKPRSRKFKETGLDLIKRRGSEDGAVRTARIKKYSTKIKDRLN